MVASDPCDGVRTSPVASRSCGRAGAAAASCPFWPEEGEAGGGRRCGVAAERDHLPLGSQQQTDIRLIWNAG